MVTRSNLPPLVIHNVYSAHNVPLGLEAAIRHPNDNHAFQNLPEPVCLLVYVSVVIYSVDTLLPVSVNFERSTVSRGMCYAMMYTLPVQNK